MLVEASPLYFKDLRGELRKMREFLELKKNIDGKAVGSADSPFAKLLIEKDINRRECLTKIEISFAMAGRVIGTIVSVGKLNECIDR